MPATVRSVAPPVTNGRGLVPPNAPGADAFGYDVDCETWVVVHVAGLGGVAGTGRAANSVAFRFTGLMTAVPST